MKKILFILFLNILGTSAFAQKEYVHLQSDGSVDIVLSGAVPSTMQNTYRYSSVGEVLNLLAKQGFVVEQMALTTGSSSRIIEVVVLSRNTSNSYNAIQRVEVNPDEEVTEVARYNLQGMPIGSNEKGIQIVVYSNYTTKTIIVE